MQAQPKVFGMDLAYTHLIAIDCESGTLWGGVALNFEEVGLARDIDRLAGEVLKNVGAGTAEWNAEKNEETLVSGDAMWRRCWVFKVLLCDDAENPPEGAPLSSQLIYHGHELGWLPDDKNAAWGEKVRK
jgi:hypothetical protein